jgi:Spy/CpxP family protein refolding chaperone
MTTRIAIAAVLAAAIPAFAVAQTASPYAGQETRPIKALSVDEVKAYLAGDGLGMAKAGELNHYPGPKHVLAMADHLGLSAQQESALRAIEGGMSAAAVPLGRQIVDAEASLDRAFANGTVDEASMRAATDRIGALQGHLRAVHLSAHIATRKLLTAEQLATYDSMRGYGDGRTDEHHHAGS